MSRTYKHIKRVKLKKFYAERWDTLYEPQELGRYWHRLKRPGVLTKKRKEVDTEDHWMSTPGWWVRLVMNRPERREHHLLEKKVLRENDLEDVDFPDKGRKPHIYYY